MFVCLFFQVVLKLFRMISVSCTVKNTVLEPVGIDPAQAVMQCNKVTADCQKSRIVQTNLGVNLEISG
jgi:hypothetical protein